MSPFSDPDPSRWQTPLRISTEVGWYDLFSRGARDWLRHNEKVRESVEKSLPNLIAGPDVLSGPGGGTVLVPVRGDEIPVVRELPCDEGRALVVDRPGDGAVPFRHQQQLVRVGLDCGEAGLSNGNRALRDSAECADAAVSGRL